MRWVSPFGWVSPIDKWTIIAISFGLFFYLLLASGPIGLAGIHSTKLCKICLTFSDSLQSLVKQPCHWPMIALSGHFQASREADSILSVLHRLRAGLSPYMGGIVLSTATLPVLACLLHAASASNSGNWCQCTNAVILSSILVQMGAIPLKFCINVNIFSYLEL